MIVLGGGDLGRDFSHKGETFLYGISGLTKETLPEFPAPHHVRTQEEGAGYKPRREPGTACGHSSAVI